MVKAYTNSAAEGDSAGWESDLAVLAAAGVAKFHALGGGGLGRDGHDLLLLAWFVVRLAALPHVVGRSPTRLTWRLRSAACGRHERLLSCLPSQGLVATGRLPAVQLASAQPKGSWAGGSMAGRAVGSAEDHVRHRRPDREILAAWAGKELSSLAAQPMDTESTGPSPSSIESCTFCTTIAGSRFCPPRTTMPSAAGLATRLA